MLIGMLLLVSTSTVADWKPQTDRDAAGIVDDYEVKVVEARERGAIVDVHHFSRIDFSAGGTDLSAADRGILDALGAAWDEPAMAGAGVILVGHSSGEGEPQANADLSAARAEAVAAYLQQTYGLDRERFAIRPFGETAPKSGEDPDDPRQRRVEIYIATALAPETRPRSLPLPSGVRLFTFGPDSPPAEAFLPFGGGRSLAGLGLDGTATIEFWVSPDWASSGHRRGHQWF